MGGKLEAGYTPVEALSWDLGIEVVVDPEIFEDVSYAYDFRTGNVKTLAYHLISGGHLDGASGSRVGSTIQTRKIGIDDSGYSTIKKLVGQRDIYRDF